MRSSATLPRLRRVPWLQATATQSPTTGGQGKEVSKYYKVPAPPDTAVRLLNRMGYSCWVYRAHPPEIAPRINCYYEVTENGRCKMASRYSDLFISLAVAQALQHIGAGTDTNNQGED